MKTGLSVEEKIKQHYEKLGLSIIDYSIEGLIYAHAVAHKELSDTKKKQSNLNCFLIDSRKKVRASIYNKIMEILQ